MKISACIIVKDEEEIIEDCLKSVQEADEILIADTGSTDKTLEIASKYTDKIYHFPWNGSFAEARNFIASKATGDWILSIDADHELLTPISKIKEICQKTKSNALSIKSIGRGWHYRKVLWRNGQGIKWVDKVHENLNTPDNEYTDIERKQGYSKNHYKDPQRNLKILLTMDKTPRTLFYLGREYFDLREYDKALEMFNDYILKSTWLPEKMEAYYSKARCLWYLQRGEEAREACLKAIQLNPDCKKALLFMSEMHYEPRKSKWLKLSEIATDKDVIFR